MTSYKLAQDIDLQPLDDEMIALDLSRNAYYSLNETARMLITGITSGKQIGQIAEDAAAVYDGTDVPQILDDFRNALDEMISLGIIVRKECDG